MANSLNMYNITQNIYCSQLYSVAVLLQPESVSHSVVQGKDCVLCLSMLSSCGLPLPPTCLFLTVNEARSYFASTIPYQLDYYNDRVLRTFNSIRRVYTVCSKSRFTEKKGVIMLRYEL
jgi:hypothetical protein